MTKRATDWPIKVPVGTTKVGTANVRDDAPRMGFAQKRLAEKFGTRPVTGFDEIADCAPVVSLAPGRQSPVPKTARKSKYGNTKCESGGVKFDSKREMMRWHELVQMQIRGEISELELQVPFVLADPVVIKGRKRPALRYVADFVYERGGQTVIEDVKGRETEGYRIKRHLMAARGLTIEEIK